MRTYLVLIIVGCALPVGDVRAGEDSAEQIEFFEAKIRPVLIKHCYECHSSESEKVKGGLMLDSREATREGGDTGPAVVPGDVEEGLLLAAIRYEDYEMPPSGKLPDAVIADFEKWIKLGAADPRDGSGSEIAATEIDFAAARKAWAFQPPQRQPAPEVSNPNWIKSPLDAFALARLEAAGLQPSEPADSTTLVRRVYFTLTGLPPTPTELEAFAADDSPDAYERLVERLLASPAYGERWATMWLDLARYAEDQAHIVGNNKALFYPNAYRYRRWVIKAFNRDLHFDEFVLLQLAADLIDDTSEEDQVAFGLLGLGPKYYRRNAPEVMADEWEDRVDVVSRGLLGLTVACARCHDHKFDPIPTSDYYALAGVFASTEMFNKPLPKEEQAKENDDKKDGDKKKDDKSPENTIHVVRDSKPRDLEIHIRGDAFKPGDLAPRGFPRILCGDDQPIAFTEGSGRRELAEAIVARENPLTARVIVNRVWGMHFGRPIVGTPSNFGALGQPPTHPQLLDDLAARFMENGWSLKWLHREIVLSATWRQSSQIDPAKQEVDADNQLLWRANRRRLSVEAWRDSLLAAAGKLDRSVGGESLDPTDPDENRRTVYSYVSRLELHPMLSMFDHPDPNAHSGSRVETTTPLQKMFVMNSPFMVATAEAFAQRCIDSADNDIERIEFAFQTLYARSSRDQELILFETFLSVEDATTERWKLLAQAMFAANETMLID